MERLRREKAKTGDSHISFAWNNSNDLDLHVIQPNGEEIYFKNKTSISTGAVLDVDMNFNENRSDKPVENVYWPKGKALRGHYQIKVVHYANKGAPDPTSYMVIVELYGKSFEFRQQISHGESPHIWEFDV
jgi:uncharacterized protein YfaP (DUF2135 family)